MHTVQLADSIVPIGELVDQLGLPEELESVIGVTEKEVAFLVGGSDLQASSASTVPTGSTQTPTA